MKLPAIKATRSLRRRILIAIGALILFFGYFAYGVAMDNRRSHKAIDWGVTFSVKYAKELGYAGAYGDDSEGEWRKIFLAALDDLKIRNFRIPIYWDEIQREEGPYDWRGMDWIMDEAAKRGAKVILVVGRRVPRWPECHVPRWVSQKGGAEENQMVLDLVRAEAERYKGSPALYAWQLENEPLLDVFGDCPPGDPDFLGQERSVLKSIDSSHPVIITDSGELSLWYRAALSADILGISMYRVTWSKQLGYFYYPITPAYYRDKAKVLFPLVKKVIVTELQAEPWPSDQRSIPHTPIPEQYKSMNVSSFDSNVEFARRVGFDQVYLWGVEWWYWIKERGDSSFWDKARQLFENG